MRMSVTQPRIAPLFSNYANRRTKTNSPRTQRKKATTRNPIDTYTYKDSGGCIALEIRQTAPRAQTTYFHCRSGAIALSLSLSLCR